MPTSKPSSEDKHIGRFLYAMANFDDLVAVVIGQTYVESNLRSVIRDLMPDTERFDGLRLTFEPLLGLALSTKSLPCETESALRKLASIRNKYAHRIEYALQPIDVDAVFQSLPTALQRDVEFLETKASFPEMATHARRLRAIYILIYATLRVARGDIAWQETMQKITKEKAAELADDELAKLLELAKRAFATGLSAGTIAAIFGDDLANDASDGSRQAT